MRKPSVTDIKKAMNNVQAVHACPTCLGYLNLIKEHQKKGHKDE